MDFERLLKEAQKLTNPRRLSEFVEVAEVGAALLTDKGNLYTGVNMDVACGIGFCAEHSAVAQMVKAGENKVVKMVAVGSAGRIMPPCGRCRELVNQIGPENGECEVLVAKGKIVKLKELLPFDWRG